MFNRRGCCVSSNEEEAERTAATGGTNFGADSKSVPGKAGQAVAATAVATGQSAEDVMPEVSGVGQEDKRTGMVVKRAQVPEGHIAARSTTPSPRRRRRSWGRWGTKR